MGLLDLESDKDCIPYARRPEWSDVSPLPLPPGDTGKVVSIQYSERHAEALGYFRAILAKVRAGALLSVCLRVVWAGRVACRGAVDL